MLLVADSNAYAGPLAWEGPYEDVVVFDLSVPSGALSSTSATTDATSTTTSREGCYPYVSVTPTASRSLRSRGGAVAQTQRFAGVDGSRTWTVVGDDHLPVDWIEEYLDGLRLRVYRTSPNMVNAYARGLGLYQSFLDDFCRGWRDADLETFGEFVAWLRDKHPGQQDDTLRAAAVATTAHR